MNEKLLILIAGCFFSSVLMAEDNLPKSPEWYEVIGGILAIPAAVLGLAYSYILIRKTRLESRKTELEIREKELALEALPDVERSRAKDIIAPIVPPVSG